MMRVYWSSEAYGDAKRAVDYGATLWPIASERLMGEILSLVASLIAFPEIGRPGELPGTRELVMQRYPFIIIYAVGDGVITILHVNHQKMRWPPSDLTSSIT